MILKKTFTSILFTIFFVSCDYEATEHYVLDNKSIYELNLVYVKNNLEERTNVIIKPSETKDFYQQTTATAVSKNKGDNYLDVFDTIYISINDTLILDKDLYNMDNWDYWHYGTRNSESIFTFSINKTDLKTKTKNAL